MAIFESEFTTPGSSARIWLVLQVDLVSQNITTNQSTLNWYLRGEERIVNASPFNLNGVSSGSAKVGNLVGGTDNVVFNSGGLSYDFRATFATYNWASGTTTVTHAADGTATIKVEASFNSGDSILGTASFATSMVLTTIPRATTPTVSPSSGETAQTYTIGHAPASSGFYHDVAYGFAGTSGSFTDIQTNIVGTDTSTDWTPAHSLITDAVSKTATIRLITRDSSGGTIIGTKYVDLPLAVPSTVVPTVSATSFVDSQTASPDIPTLMGGAGRFVQGWSKLLPTVTASGAFGSTITDTDVTINAQTVNSGTAFPSAIALSGAVPFSTVATDTRGRTSDAFTGTVSVTAYNFPSLPTPTVQRTSDAAGNTPSPTGTYLAITPLAAVSDLTFSSVQKNLLEYQIRWRLKGAGSWTTAFAWGSSGVTGYTWTSKSMISGALSTSEYEVEVSIRDVFGKNGYDTANTVKTLVVPVASESVFMDWNEDVGLGIGRYHTGSGAFVQVAGSVDATDIQANGVTILSPTETRPGIVELATQAETSAGTDDIRYVSPAKLAAWGSAFAASRLLANKALNGDFRVNQKGITTGTSLTPQQMFHDQWFCSGLANLTFNPTGGTNTTGWGGTGATISRLTGLSISGLTGVTTAIRATMTAVVGGAYHSGDITSPYISITGGKQYTVSAWLRSSVAKTVRPSAQFANASGAAGANIDGVGTALTANTWQQVTWTFTANSGATRMGPYWYTTVAWAAGNTLDVAGVMVLEGDWTSRMPDYFDGSISGSMWSGTSHASTSYNITALPSITFTTAVNGYYVTLSSGGRVYKVIPKENAPSGALIAGHGGTAQMRIYKATTAFASRPSFAAGPVSMTSDGTDDIILEFYADGGATKTIGEAWCAPGATAIQYVPRLYSEELASCQRFYFSTSRNSVASSPLSDMGAANSTTSCIVRARLPVTMASLPAIGGTAIGSLVVRRMSAGTTTVPSLVAIDATEATDAIRGDVILSVTVAAATLGEMTYLRTVSTGQYLDFDSNTKAWAA